MSSPLVVFVAWISPCFSLFCFLLKSGWRATPWFFEVQLHVPFQGNENGCFKITLNPLHNMRLPLTLVLLRFQCYRDLKQTENAKKFRDLAEQLPCITREVSPDGAKERYYFTSTTPASDVNRGWHTSGALFYTKPSRLGFRVNYEALKLAVGSLSPGDPLCL